MSVRWSKDLDWAYHDCLAVFVKDGGSLYSYFEWLVFWMTSKSWFLILITWRFNNRIRSGSLVGIFKTLIFLTPFWLTVVYLFSLWCVCMCASACVCVCVQLYGGQRLVLHGKTSLEIAKLILRGSWHATSFAYAWSLMAYLVPVLFMTGMT